MKKLFCFILLISMLSSCRVVNYSANVVNVPMLENKGEGNVSVATNLQWSTDYNSGFVGILDQFDLSSSYAITDKIGIQLNCAYYYPRDQDEYGKGSGFLGELGVGYYKRVSPKLILETYGLLGLGTVQNKFKTTGYYNDLNGSYYSNLLRIGIQPSITHKRKAFFYSLATRLVMVNFFNIKGNLVQNEEDLIQKYKEHANFLLLLSPHFP